MEYRAKIVVDCEDYKDMQYEKLRFEAANSVEAHRITHNLVKKCLDIFGNSKTSVDIVDLVCPGKNERVLTKPRDKNIRNF